MNLGEMYERIRPIMENPNFSQIESDSGVEVRVDTLHKLIEQTPMDQEAERLVEEFVNFCEDKLSKVKGGESEKES